MTDILAKEEENVNCFMIPISTWGEANGMFS